jgi:hypothetical protein
MHTPESITFSGLPLTQFVWSYTQMNGITSFLLYVKHTMKKRHSTDRSKCHFDLKES